jgi:hypothetical protein
MIFRVLLNWRQVNGIWLLTYLAIVLCGVSFMGEFFRLFEDFPLKFICIMSPCR